MACVTGLVYREGEFIEGYVEFDNEKTVFGDGIRKDSIAKGIIIPKFVNCHTHLGDVFIQKPEGGSIEELVAPPNSLKHRMLRQVSEEEQVTAMRQAIMGMARSGISHFIDFREGGLEGAKRLLKAAMGIDIKPTVFGRPVGEKYDKTEMASLLPIVDGIGVSALVDWDYEGLRLTSEHTRKAGKTFALHCSELVREDLEVILGLKPAFLVHMIEATDSDLEACTAGNVPIVICPTVNSFFGIRPPLERMIRAGVRICLGTDNAMLAPPDMFSEMRALRSLLSEEAVSDAGLFDMVFDNGRKALNSILGLGGEVSGYPEFLVLDRPLENPYKQVLQASAENIHPISYLGKEECGDTLWK